MPTYPPPPVTFVRGEGTRLWDDAGKAYLDFLSGLAVTSLGHSHPVVADALAEQSQRLLHVSNLFGNEHNEPLAAALDRLVGDGEPLGGKVFFCNSGAEANECAIKLARKFGGRGRHVVVSAPTAASTAGRSRRCTPPASRPSTSRSSRCPRGSGTSTWQRPRRARAAPSTRRSPPSCSSPCRARAASTRPAPSTSRACAGCATSAGLLLIMDEVQTGPRPHRPLVRLPARRRRARRRHDGEGARQRRAHRRLLGQGRGRRRLRARRPRHDLRRPAAGRRRRACRRSASSSASTRPAWRPSRASGS